MKRGARLVAVLLLGVTFIVGGLTGMVLEEALGLNWFEFLDRESGDREDRLLVGLGLSGEKRSRAEEILERRKDRLEAYWESRLPEIEGILEASYAEIRTLLSPEQRSAFDRRVRELRGRVPEEVRD